MACFKGDEYLCAECEENKDSNKENCQKAKRRIDDDDDAIIFARKVLKKFRDNFGVVSDKFDRMEDIDGLGDSNNKINDNEMIQRTIK